MNKSYKRSQKYMDSLFDVLLKLGIIKKKCYLKDHATLGDLLCLVNTCGGQ